MGNDPSRQLDNQIFNLKFTAKQFQKEAKKAEKDASKSKLKVKKCLEEGDRETAKHYAGEAIRKHNEGMNYLKLSARLDAVQDRLKSAQATKQITKSMVGVTRTMDLALKSMDINKVGVVMDQFEKQFEELDMRSTVVDQTMAEATGVAKEADEVDDLMAQIADEHGMEIAVALDEHNVPTKVVRKKEEEEIKDSDEDLESRLKALEAL